MEKNALLDEAERLHKRRDFSSLKRLLARPHTTTVLDDPELGYYLAQAHFQLGDHSTARELLTLLHPVYRWRENDRTKRRYVNLCGVIEIFDGNLDQAERWLSGLSSAAFSVGDQEFVACATMNLGIIADIRLRWEEAISMYRHAEAAYLRMGNQADLGSCYNNLGMAYRQLGRYSEAADHFERALEHFQEFNSLDATLGCESERALLLHLRGDSILAERTGRSALEKCRALKNTYLEGELLRCLGIILSDRDLRCAQDYLVDAIVCARRVGTPILEAECNEQLAVLAVNQGDLVAAVHLWSEAARLYGRAGAVERAKRVERNGEGSSLQQVS
jgi:tetratricopeptide (TPR) repeat protein